MVVDDSRMVRRIAREILTGLGYSVVEAEHGAEALDRVRAHGLPDLILLDWNMPVMSGLQTLKELRKAVPELPKVMFCTTNSEPSISMPESKRARPTGSSSRSMPTRCRPSWKRSARSSRQHRAVKPALKPAAANSAFVPASKSAAPLSISFAIFLPSSTPNWSNGLIPISTALAKVRCS